MRLLLDTHAFLWLITGDSKLTRSSVDLLTDPANAVFLSPVSLWEVLVKHAIGKLALPTNDPAAYLVRQRERHEIGSLPLDEPTVARLASLPKLHNDPFDRMLICQAIQHGLTLVTSDRTILQYPVPALELN